jgi:hypothetical protein
MPEFGLVPVIDYDPRDLDYPMAAALPPVAVLPDYKYWAPGAAWDQDGYPHCVGFSFGKLLRCPPLRFYSAEGYKGNDLGSAIYAQCKTIDNYSGDGTSLHAGVRVLNGETGWHDRVLEYRWCWDYETMESWLLTKGPVIIGIPWYSSFNIGTRASMPTMPDPSGTLAGYHAMCVYGTNRIRAKSRATNSWGMDYGYRGKVDFRRETLEEILFSDKGAGCMGVVERQPT